MSLRELVGSSLPKKSRTQTIEMITEFLRMKIIFCFVGGGSASMITVFYECFVYNTL